MVTGKDSYSFFVRSLRKLMDRYEGQYVAIVDNLVVSHGKDAQIVFERARISHPHDRILVGQVPAKEAMIFWTAYVFRSQDKDLKR